MDNNSAYCYDYSSDIRVGRDLFDKTIVYTAQQSRAVRHVVKAIVFGCFTSDVVAATRLSVYIIYLSLMAMCERAWTRTHWGWIPFT
jgi:hypothetical protein